MRATLQKFEVDEEDGRPFPPVLSSIWRSQGCRRVRWKGQRQRRRKEGKAAASANEDEDESFNFASEPAAQWQDRRGQIEQLALMLQSISSKSERRCWCGSPTAEDGEKDYVTSRNDLNVCRRLKTRTLSKDRPSWQSQGSWLARLRSRGVHFQPHVGQACAAHG